MQNKKEKKNPAFKKINCRKNLNFKQLVRNFADFQQINSVFKQSRTVPFLKLDKYGLPIFHHQQKGMKTIFLPKNHEILLEKFASGEKFLPSITLNHLPKHHFVREENKFLCRDCALIIAHSREKFNT